MLVFTVLVYQRRSVCDLSHLLEISRSPLRTWILLHATWQFWTTVIYYAAYIDKTVDSLYIWCHLKHTALVFEDTVVVCLIVEMDYYFVLTAYMRN